VSSGGPDRTIRWGVRIKATPERRLAKESARHAGAAPSADWPQGVAHLARGPTYRSLGDRPLRRLRYRYLWMSYATIETDDLAAEQLCLDKSEDDEPTSGNARFCRDLRIIPSRTVFGELRD